MPDTPEYPPAPAPPPGSPPAAPPVDPAEAAAVPPIPELSGYPVRLHVERQETYSRLMPLIKWWLLLIPQFIVLYVLALVAGLASFVAFFAVLITGRYPRGLFNFVVGVQRWSFRVGAYFLFMRDPYPPFALAPDPAFGLTYEVDYPEDGINRWRPLVQWLLILPYLIIAQVLVYVALIVWIFAFFTIVFTRKYPAGLFNMVHVALNWNARGNAYSGFLVKKYPPFVWG